MASLRRIPIAARTRTSSDRDEVGAAIAIFTIIMLGVAIPAFFFISWAYNFFQAREEAQVLAALAAKAGASQTIAYNGDDDSGVVEIDCSEAISAAGVTWSEARSRITDGAGYQMTLPEGEGSILAAKCTRPARGLPVNRFTVTIEDTYRGDAITGWLGYEATFTVSGEAVILPTE